MAETILPPRLFLRLFKAFCNPSIHRYVEGDLIEIYQQRRRTSGVLTANLRFALDVILLFRPGIIRSIQLDHSPIQHAMLKNYFTVALRHLLKYRVFSSINIFGLAMAMSVAMLIILMLMDQLRYDDFHVKGDRIYRVNSARTYATSPLPLANVLTSEYAAVEDAVSLTPAVSGDGIYQDRLADIRGYFTNPSFFNIFSFDLIEGNKSTALKMPRSIVITKAISDKLFKGDSPIGKEILFDDRKRAFPQRFDGVGASAASWGAFTVTGVIDEAAYKSHLQFDALVSSSTMPLLYAAKKMEDQSDAWDAHFRTYTFVLLSPGYRYSDLKIALDNVVHDKYKDLTREAAKDFTLDAQSLSSVQFEIRGNDTSTRLPLVAYYFLGGLALIIIVSACLNYTNLSIARALTRAKEIGVRKVTGASKHSLVFQFMSESVLTSVFALVMALLFLALLKPAFRGLWINQYLNFELPESPVVYLIFLGVAILIGIIAGTFPAFRLSKYQPVKALKTLHDKAPGKINLVRTIGVVQLVISLFFISTSLLIYSQFSHYAQFDYGFRSRGIVNLELQGLDYAKLQHEMQTIQGVEKISASDLIPATGSNNGNQFKPVAKDSSAFEFMSILNVDENYVDNLELDIIAGADLLASDSAFNHILINESAVALLGFSNPNEIIGQEIQTKWGNETLQVAGVVKNFSYIIPMGRDKIEGLILRNQPKHFQYMNIKLNTANVPGTLQAIESAWKKFDPLHPVRYKFFDDELAATNQAIKDLFSILGFIAFLSIAIASLGLLGMATYTAERSRKEVSIRKIMGAESGRIAWLLSRSFARMIILAVLIGAPLSYFVNRLWLEYIPNRTDANGLTVIVGVCILAAISGITVISQTLRASLVNPVHALKTE